jgi:hypothetical protein
MKKHAEFFIGFDLSDGEAFIYGQWIDDVTGESLGFLTDDELAEIADRLNDETIRSAQWQSLTS